MRPSRAEAEALLFELTQSDALRKHARGVDGDARLRAAAIGRPLEEHIAFVIEALRPIAGELGL
jgi:predicted hydrolase (HD superfamily)